MSRRSLATAAPSVEDVDENVEENITIETDTDIIARLTAENEMLKEMLAEKHFIF